jgi:hypothetical protein
MLDDNVKQSELKITTRLERVIGTCLLLLLCQVHSGTV